MFGNLFAGKVGPRAVQLAAKALRDLPAMLQPFPFDPDEVALRAVNYIEAKNALLFAGKQGKMPTATATAALSLAGILLETDNEQTLTCQPMACLALGNILLDCSNNPHKHNFYGVDVQMLTVAEKGYMAYMARTEPKRDAILGGLR